MGTGYTRNDSSNNIADGNVINASDLDGEYDAIESAFGTSGHTHDGTSGEGGVVTVLGPAQDFVVSASVIKPKTDNTLDIGTSSLEFKDLYLDGLAYIDGLGETMLVATDKAIQFRDTAISINSSTDGQLDIDADTEIEITSPTVDINASTVVNISTDLIVGDDLTLQSDAAVLNFGADSDVSLTHVADTGLLLNAGSAIQFRDAALAINSSADGQLDIIADTQLEITTPTLELNSDAQIIAIGADGDVTVTHEADTGLKMKAASGFELNLQTGDTSVESGNVLGKITFNAPSESSGSDALLDGAAIEAVAEGTFSSTVNTTKLSFKTGASEAATEKMSLSSGGALSVTGALTAGGILKTDDTTDATSTTDGSLQTDGGLSVVKKSVLGDDVTFTGANYNVTWDKSANLLQFVDDAVLRIGTGNDLDIYHSSNVNFIKTQTDLPINIVEADGNSMVTLTPNGETVFNDSSEDRDFRVEGNARSNLLVVDGGVDQLGVGMTPDQSWGSNSVGINFGIADADAGWLGWQVISGGDNFNMLWNVYHDNSDFRYASNNGAGMYTQNNGSHLFYGAATGSADAVITFTENFRTNTIGAVFNEGSADLDFRVESDGNANMLFVDGGNNCVGIGTNTNHGGELNIETTGGATNLALVCTDTDGNAGPILDLRRDAGNVPSDNDAMGVINFQNDNTDLVMHTYASISAFVDDVSAGTEDGVLRFSSIINGTEKNRIDIIPTAIVINEGAADSDFRVEGNNFGNVLFVDSGKDTVGIRTLTPSSTAALSVHGDGAANYGGMVIRLTDSTNTNNGGVAIMGATKADPTVPWTGVGFWDQGSVRQLSYGGGSWGYEEATAHHFYTGSYGAGSGGATERMRINSAGQVSVGFAGTPDSHIKILSAGTNTTNYIGLRNTTASDGSGARYSYINYEGTQSGGEISTLAQIGAEHQGTADDEKGNLVFTTNDGNDGDSPNERMRIGNHGKITSTTIVDDWNLVLDNGNSSAPYGQSSFFSAAAPDNNTSLFLNCADNGVTTRLNIYSDGDVANHDNSYGSLSDERIKQDIVDANSQWDDIKAVRVRNYKKKDDVDQYGDKAWSQIGVIAQELEAVSPKLIKEALPTASDIKHSSEFGTLYEDGDTIPDGKKVGDVKEIKENVKKVSYSILYMKAIKALQEAMARIETLEAKVTALEGE